MQKGRLMELTNNNEKCDSALPSGFVSVIRQLDLQPIWYVWTYQNSGAFGRPINLTESFFSLLDKTKITVQNGLEVSILDLVETLLTHPEEVEIKIK